jgi:hypothetical protein
LPQHVDIDTVSGGIDEYVALGDVLTLTTYADYISEDETAAPKLARPVATMTEKLCH